MKVDTNVEQVNEKFSNLEVELEDIEIAELLGNWAKQNLAPASLYVFEEQTECVPGPGPSKIFEALGHAIFNDIVVKALEETVKEVSVSQGGGQVEGDGPELERQSTKESEDVTKK